ncbi:MAG: metalloregulator ArsR/SmtB family transcription factor [Nanoarchaeota archaeon]|nr:metalloregulator ArsR/SmtB family transcription factor [Nanoarchaeota archaeon]
MYKNITKLAKVFSALSDETRLKIVMVLMNKNMQVTQIHEELGKEKISLSGISHQLKYLTNLDLVISQKNGREKEYSLSKDFCWCILKHGMNHFDNKCNCACSKIKNG